MSSYDAMATAWVNSFSGSWRPLDLLLIAITTVGAPVMILAVAVRWWSPGDRMHERHAAVAAGLSFLLGLTLNQVLLLFAHRMRPYDAGVTHLLIARSRDPSFPSDHATAAFSIVFAFLFQKRFLRALSVLACRVAAGDLPGLSRHSLCRRYTGRHGDGADRRLGSPSCLSRRDAPRPMDQQHPLGARAVDSRPAA